MTNTTEITPPGCLTIEDLTARMGWASPAVGRTLSSRSKRRRDAGTPRPGDLPAPDGYVTRPRRRPYWTLATIEAWENSRPTGVREADNAVEDGHKRCSKCREVKPVSDYYETIDRRFDPPVMRVVARCKACHAGAALDWLNDNPEQRRAADSAYKRRPEVRRRIRVRKYGLTVDDLAAMEDAQDGRCLICGRPEETLVIDHCHSTGKVRGLLCGLCNLGLGAFRDRPHVLASAMAYLINSTAA